MFLRPFAAVLAAGMLLAACKDYDQPAQPQEPTHAPHLAANTPDEAIARLKEGNQRYVDGKLLYTDYKSQREETKDDQHPYAMILSCMDSRVPPEIVFDQGIGNIFVGRVAGNIEDTNMLGSLEYATVVKGSKLVVVMGHGGCGAVKGAVDNVELGNLTRLLGHIRPAIKGDTADRAKLVMESIRNNVRLTAAHITERSSLIADLVKSGKVKIIGAYYDLASGKVEFLD